MPDGGDAGPSEAEQRDRRDASTSGRGESGAWPATGAASRRAPPEQRQRQQQQQQLPPVLLPLAAAAAGGAPRHGGRAGAAPGRRGSWLEDEEDGFEPDEEPFGLPSSAHLARRWGVSGDHEDEDDGSGYHHGSDRDWEEEEDDGEDAAGPAGAAAARRAPRARFPRPLRAAARARSPGDALERRARAAAAAAAAAAGWGPREITVALNGCGTVADVEAIWDACGRSPELNYRHYAAAVQALARAAGRRAHASSAERRRVSARVACRVCKGRFGSGAVGSTEAKGL